MSSEIDARLSWIKTKACRGLGVDTQLFDEALETGSSDALNGFLNGVGDSTALLISLNQTTIEVEELHEVNDR